MEKTVQLYEGKAKKVFATENEELVKLCCILGCKLGRVAAVLREKQRHRVACVA